MSQELRVYDALVLLDSGSRVLDEGSVIDPVEAVTITGNWRDGGGFSLAAGATRTLWIHDGTATGPFFSLVRLQTDLYLELWIKADTATNYGTDNRATGTAITYNCIPMDSYAPMLFSSPVTKTNATAANHANTMYGGTGEVTGYIYQIGVKNPSSTTAANVSFQAMN